MLQQRAMALRGPLLEGYLRHRNPLRDRVRMRKTPRPASHCPRLRSRHHRLWRRIESIDEYSSYHPFCKLFA